MASRESARFSPVLGAVIVLVGGAASLAASATDLPTAVDLVPPSAAAAAPAVPARPLDLRLPNPRRFIPPEQLNEPWTEELDEVLIRPRRQPPDLPERRAVPQGLAGLFWAARRPTQAWRLLVPDPNAPVIPLRSPDDPKEPPGAFRSRIGEPGKIF